MDGDALVMQGVVGGDGARSSRLGGDSDGAGADEIGVGDMKPNKSDESHGVFSFSRPSIDEDVVMGGSRCGSGRRKLAGQETLQHWFLR